MAEFTFAQMMRTGHVKRWQIVRTAREQTLAEHLYRVWVITQFICRAIDAPREVSDVANLWALIHDVPEVITGDIATPAKEAMRRAVPDQDPIKNIELGLSRAYRDTWTSSKIVSVLWPGPTAYEIVKLADMIEAQCFMSCEAQGDHAREVSEAQANKVVEMYDGYKVRYPDLDWSGMEKFITQTWIAV
jgi:hypothetical protein